MTPGTHLSTQDLIAHLDGTTLDAGVLRHLDTCARCRTLVTILRGTAAGEPGSWTAPPESTLQRALEPPAEPRLPDRGTPQAIPWPSPDVRGAAAPPSGGRILAGSCEGGQVSLIVHPPQHDARWGFELRVWTRDGNPAVAGLLHDDHVLRRQEVADGETLRFEEVVPAGWRLHILLPNGDAIRIDDPTGT